MGMHLRCVLAVYGNPVIVKPHPTAILPMAFAIRRFREVLGEAGFAPDLVTMCLDTMEAPIGKVMVQRPLTAIVDVTGSARFGAWVEANAHPALCCPETSGVNTVVVESVDQLEPVIKSLTTTLSLFSAQMCTSPQNIYLPREGVRHAGGRVGADEFCAQLTSNLTGPMPLNFAAAYSDYHVTGLNPAGNATLTDLAFVASRFRITQSRMPVA